MAYRVPWHISGIYRPLPEFRVLRNTGCSIMLSVGEQWSGFEVLENHMWY